MSISMDKRYRTRDGREVRIYAIDAGKIRPIHGAIFKDGEWRMCTWNKDGVNFYGDNLDLIEVKPRIQREYWINVYPKDVGKIWMRKEDALACPFDRIACVKITIDCEEGEGL